MHIEEQIYEYFNAADETIYTELNKLNKDELYNLIDYYNRHDLVKYYELIYFLYNYLEFNF